MEHRKCHDTQHDKFMKLKVCRDTRLYTTIGTAVSFFGIVLDLHKRKQFRVSRTKPMEIYF